MRDLHQVEIRSEKQQREEQKLAASGQQLDPMQGYLQGTGKSLPADTRFHGRKRPRDEIPEDVAVLQEENKRLREMLDKMGDELRRERARAEQEIQSAEQARRDQEELKQLAQSDPVWGAHKDEIKEMREKMRVEHEKEITKVHDRRDKNERRLWNLFNPYV